MKIITDLKDIRLKNTIVAIGKFDGFHLGHQKLIEYAVSLNDGTKKTVIFTFLQHPGRMTDTASLTIDTRSEREDGIFPDKTDYLIEYPFDDKTMNMSPESFVKDILVEKLGAKDIVTGSDFRFGKNRSGDIMLLTDLGLRFGFSVHTIDKVFTSEDGLNCEISSTLVKKLISEGEMETVRKLLGRPYSVTGKVLSGKRLGRTIGFPTINQDMPKGKAIPPFGVYATKVMIGSQLKDSVTNIGVRPSFDDGDKITVETNIFDHSEDLYGKTLTVFFYRFIRPERKFSSTEELSQQMEKDKDQVRNYFRRIMNEYL